MSTLGIDEAGRGCVLGPLVVGGFLVDDTGPLAEIGVTDSKRLSAKRREEIAAKLTHLGEGALEEIAPAQIDDGNVNTLEEAAFVRLIARFRPRRVIIDAPCHPAAIPALVRRLRGHHNADYVVEPKADLNHLPVGAASILAKVRRDAHIVALGAVGSGYPSDPVTRAWLQGFLDRKEPFPSCVRTRWGTIASLRQGALF
jgi:ribonuclease HII